MGPLVMYGLFAVDDVGVAVLARGGGEVLGVGADLGLGDRDGHGAGAGGEGGEGAGLLGGGAEAGEEEAGDHLVAGPGDAEAGDAAGLDEGHFGGGDVGVGAAVAAVFGGQADGNSPASASARQRSVGKPLAAAFRARRGGCGRRRSSPRACVSLPPDLDWSGRCVREHKG